MFTNECLALRGTPEAHPVVFHFLRKKKKVVYTSRNKALMKLLKMHHPWIQIWIFSFSRFLCSLNQLVGKFIEIFPQWNGKWIKPVQHKPSIKQKTTHGVLSGQSLKCRTNCAEGSGKAALCMLCFSLKVLKSGTQNLLFWQVMN